MSRSAVPFLRCFKILIEPVGPNALKIPATKGGKQAMVGAGGRRQGASVGQQESVLTARECSVDQRTSCSFPAFYLEEIMCQAALPTSLKTALRIIVAKVLKMVIMRGFLVL